MWCRRPAMSKSQPFINTSATFLRAACCAAYPKQLTRPRLIGRSTSCRCVVILEGGGPDSRAGRATGWPTGTRASSSTSGAVPSAAFSSSASPSSLDDAPSAKSCSRSASDRGAAARWRTTFPCLASPAPLDEAPAPTSSDGLLLEPALAPVLVLALAVRRNFFLPRPLLGFSTSSTSGADLPASPPDGGAEDASALTARGPPRLRTFFLTSLAARAALSTCGASPVVGSGGTPCRSSAALASARLGRLPERRAPGCPRAGGEAACLPEARFAAVRSRKLFLRVGVWPAGGAFSLPFSAGRSLDLSAGLSTGGSAAASRAFSSAL
mmetsp:Transcript_20120/g.62980  ORF Transcript_20120/g.62980 Transcript_20120/m.62980 type:complete len:325 (-) Transcript_20120:1-975(-)